VNTIKVPGTGDTDKRLADLEQAINYGEVILPFPVIGEVEGTGGGTAGPPGPGVAPGGTTGQVLSKASAADYDTTWTTPAGGGATLAYRHVQASAATVWTIPHNLSFRPNVAAVDSTGREIVPGAVDYTSATAVQLTFSAAVGGEAYLS
jgi:hypothetical protein